MAKSKGARGAGQSAVGEVERRARAVAEEMNLELVEVTLQKESRGKCLCVYVDKEGGLSLDDCERYHKRLQPMLEDVDYDIMEVSSPGADRPVKTRRDFEKHRGELVEVRLFAARDGAKAFRGLLTAMDDATVTITGETEQPLVFQRRRDYAFKAITNIDSERVFENNEFVWGADARVNVGFGLWQLARASRQTRLAQRDHVA